MTATLVFLFLLSGAFTQEAPPAQSLTFEALRARVPASASTSTADVQEVTVHWDAFAAAPGQIVSKDAAVPVNRFDILSRRSVPGPLPLDRNPELSVDQLVVAGVDSVGNLVAWQLIKDPRIVRAETPRADGVLTGEILYRAEAQFTIALPDRPALRSARVYQPRWTGVGWMLDLLGSFAIGEAR
jgi:hypothetical protein